MYEIDGVQYSEADLIKVAKIKGISFDELLQNPKIKQAKTSGVDMGATTPIQEAPVMESNLEDGSLESQEDDTLVERTFGKNFVTDYFGDFYRAFKSGYRQSTSLDEDLNIMSKGSSATYEEIQQFVEANKYSQEADMSDEMIEFQKIYEEEGGGVFGFLKGMVKTRFQVVPQVMASSMATMAGSVLNAEEAAQAGIAGLTAGAAAGGAITAAAGGIGAIPGGIAGLVGGVSGAMESGLTFAELMQVELEKNGQEFTKENVKALLEDEEKFRSLKNKSIGRGATIGVVEGLGTAITGGAIKAVRAGAQAARAGTKISNIAETATAFAVEGAVGGTGEALGRVVAGQEMDAAEIGLEAVGGMTGAPLAFVKAATKQPRYILNGEEISKQQMEEFIDSDNGENIATSRIKIKDDPELYNKGQEKITKARSKKSIESFIQDEADADEFVNLENEKSKLDNKSFLGKKRISEIDKRLEELYGKYTVTQEDILAEKQLIESKTQVLSEVDIAKKYAEVETIETSEEFYAKYPDARPEKGEVGGFRKDDGTLVINLEGAAKTRQYTVGSHELLHNILRSTFVDPVKSNQIAEEFKSIVKGLDGFENIQKRLDLYNGNPAQLEEIITLTSDAMAKGQIKATDTVMDKIKRMLEKLFATFGFEKAEFESGKDVFEFLKSYRKEFDSDGKLSQRAQKLAAKGAQMQGEFASIDIDTEFAKYKNPRSFVNSTLAVDVKDQPLMDFNLRNTKFGNMIGGTVESITKRLYDPIPNENKELVSRNDYKDALISEAAAMVQNEYDAGKQSLTKFVNNRLNLRANSLASRLGISSAEEGIKSDIDELRTMPDEAVTEEFDIESIDEMNMEEQRGMSLIDPIFLIEDNESAVQAIQEEIPNIQLETLIFKKVPNLVAEQLAQTFGVPATKITDPKKNLGTSEYTTAATLLSEKSSTIINILPEGAITEAASESLIGTSTGMPKNILKAFYEKDTVRRTEAQGLWEFKKLNNITKEEFNDAIGLESDGSFKKGVTGRSPESQTVKAMLNVLGKLITNAEIRKYLIEQGVNPNIIQNIAAGKSDKMFSIDLTIEEIIVDAKHQAEFALALDIILTNPSIQDALEERGLTVEDIILQIEKYKTSSTDKGTQKFEAEKIKELEKMQVKFLNGLPSIFKVYINLTKALGGYSYRTNGYGVKIETLIDIGKAKSIIDEQGNLLVDKEELKRIIKKANEINKNISTNTNISEQTESLVLAFEEKYGTKQIHNVPLNDMTRKINKAKTEQERLKILNDYRKNNGVRRSLFAITESYIHDFINAAETKEELIDRIVFALQLAAFDSNINNGLKALAEIVDDSVVDGTKTLSGETKKYRLEHLDATLQTNVKRATSILLNKRLEHINSRAQVIPLSVARKADKTTKTSNFQVKVDKINSLYSIETNEPVSNLESRMAAILSNIDRRYTAGQVLDRATAKNLAATRAKRRDLLAPSADDFVGLLYRFLDKGKLGEEQYKFFEDNLIRPFSKAYYALNAKRQLVTKSYKEINRNNKDVVKKLKKDTGFAGFTFEQALRVWLFNKAGFTPSGLNEDTQGALITIVKNNPDIQSYGEQLSSVLGIEEYWVEPDARNWQVDTIKSDMVSAVEKVSRKAMLQGWIENKDIIFSQNNMNKIEATYGPDFRAALEDMLYRMENGTARPEGTNKQMNEFLNWVRGSVAVTMFLNTRSAILQQVSLVNFINWGDNNPIKAAAAFANIDQYAKDWASIFNSDYLKERRGGLKTDVNAADLADAIKKGGVKGLHAKLLQFGFSLTQLGDSFAIATGGASFLRNRINTYLSQGMDLQMAEQRAFLDFQEISEESQQSARPDRLAKQQTDVIGRVFLAFQNTPMQYTRIIVKAAKDINAGRGDLKTNISKIAYYMVIQNVVFSAMQQALFSMLFDDEEDEGVEEQNEKKLHRIINNSIDTVIRGTGMYGAVLATAKNTILKFIEQEARQEEGKGRADHAYTLIEAMNVSPAIGIKTRQMYGSIQNYRYNKDIIDDMGFSVNNPALDVAGSVSAFTLNVPLDRAVSKMRNLKAASDAETETWAKIALTLGWNTWNVGIENEELKQVKAENKKQRELQRKQMKSSGSKKFILNEKSKNKFNL
jgi:hypothetical protein